MSTLTSYFQSRSTKAVQAAPAPVDTDYAVRTAWGISQADWQCLTNIERSNYRWNLTKAPNFRG